MSTSQIKLLSQF